MIRLDRAGLTPQVKVPGARDTVPHLVVVVHMPARAPAISRLHGRRACLEFGGGTLRTRQRES